MNKITISRNPSLRNSTLVIQDEGFEPESLIMQNLGYEQKTNKLKTRKYGRIYSNVETLFGKFKFKFVSPKKYSDAGGYYSYRSAHSIPDDYIRVCFCIRPADTITKAKSLGVSIATWQAIKGKYITIYSFKLKSGYEDQQTETMNYLSDWIKTKLDKNSKITIIPIDTNNTQTEETI